MKNLVNMLSKNRVDESNNSMIAKCLVRSIITLLVLFLILLSAASASEFRTGDRLVITRDQVINDDLYFAGNSVTVEGIINGDLIAAGSEIKVNGIINGSLMAAGGSITVDGDVVNDIRVAGGTITLNGNVGDNALAFGGIIVLGKNAKINKDLTMSADSAVIDGTVSGNINGDASNMEMRGTSNGNVMISIDNDLEILKGAKIGGNLEYTASKPVEILEQSPEKQSTKRDPRRKKVLHPR